MTMQKAAPRFPFFVLCYLISVSYPLSSDICYLSSVLCSLSSVICYLVTHT